MFLVEDVFLSLGSVKASISLQAALAQKEQLRIMTCQLPGRSGKLKLHRNQMRPAGHSDVT